MAFASDDGLTHYEILAITPKHLEGQSAPAQATVVKKAYHRALLRHHPDKTKAQAAVPSQGSSAKPSPRPQSSSTTTAYTVDQITEAYSVLSDRKRRDEYNRTLFLQQQKTASASTSSNSSNGGGAGSKSSSATWSFRTGVETADLDDLGFDERTGTYYRSCRCGNARGYRFEDADLEECEAEGVLMVGCADCSLWLRVLFAPAGDDDGGGGGGGDHREEEGKTVANQQQQQQKNNREVAGGGGGETANRGFKVNWSFSLGISVGASVSASAGSRQ
ncbi:hypothetical protein SLS62_005258 [Diatrype stigma]|uniref:Diphthamide biosynthesis protein 4 n=1 Tax=Diatrype stigma TaxID=117547 RepID=A0AAN9YPT1_9PEZI